MLKNIKDSKEARDILLALFSTSGTLAGISLALVGIVNLKAGSARIETVADDLFLLSALGFLVNCYLVFFALRHVNTRRLRHYADIVDVVFLASLTLLVLAGFAVVYAFI